MKDSLTNLYVAITTPNILPISKAIQDGINPSDLFTDIPWADGGLEKEPHVTLMYSKSTTETPTIHKVVEGIVTKQLTLIKTTPIRINGISKFSTNDDYDVIKFDVDPDNLLIFRDFIRMQFGVEANFPTFHPHITIAFVKKGVYESLDLPHNMSFDIDGSEIKIAVRGSDIEGKKIENKSVIKL